MSKQEVELKKAEAVFQKAEAKFKQAEAEFKEFYDMVHDRFVAKSQEMARQVLRDAQ